MSRTPFLRGTASPAFRVLAALLAGFVLITCPLLAWLKWQQAWWMGLAWIATAAGPVFWFGFIAVRGRLPLTARDRLN